MSCSQFIEHEDYDSSDTLVVIVNGDGTVSVDPETLQRVLNQQCRATISVVKLEDSNEPESQTGKSNSENDENLPEDKEPFCHKVNLVIEGYYPPPPNMADKSNSDAQLTQTDFLDLLSEGLEIPGSQIQGSSNEGYIGDSLIDAFSEMAPEQLKQVETALHSEKAKQILGDDITSVLADTLKFEDDDWVHLDHCYTSNYGGGRKQMLPDSEPSILTNKRELIEDPEESLRRLHELDDESIEYVGSKNANDILKLKKKNPKSLNRLKTSTEGKTTVLKKGSVSDVKSISPKDKQVHVISKGKRKSSSKNDQPEMPSERIVKDDEVDGVKVFRPTKNDKKIVKPFLFNKESAGNVALSKGLTQTKLNFPKKEMNGSEAGVKLVKKDSTDKTSPDIFGPALFSTPDIIKKMKDDKEDEKAGTSANFPINDETFEIEKRMSALENGEAILDRIQMQFEKQNKREYVISVSEDERLISDLEITDEEAIAEDATREMDDSNSELSSRKSSNVDKSESSDKDDGDYEDDPDKLWCICNKPHGNRFMICCDGCDNWYHGSCVGVTRQMGEKMEVNGTEWLCPSCRKGKSAKERDAKLKTTTRTAAAASANKATNRQSISSSSMSVSTDDASSIATPSSSAAASSATRRKSTSQLVTKLSSSHLCIECRKERTMLEAKYCSAECILKYVGNKIALMNSQLSEPLPNDQKIIVVDKRRDHRITGMRGPSVSNLTEWLLEHPSYEIVKPSAFPMRLPAPKESTKSVTTSATILTPLAVKPKIVPTKSKPAEMIEAAQGSPQTTIRQFFTIKTSGEGGSTQKIRKDEPSNNIIIREGNVLRFGSGAKKELDAKLKDKQRQIKLIPLQSLPKSDEPMTKPTALSTPKKTITPVAVTEKEKKKEPVAQQSQQTQQQATRKEKPPAKKELQRQDLKKSTTDESDSQSTPMTATAQPPVPKGPEPIRANIRNSLTETFLARAKDVANLNVSEAEFTSLASKVEEELFNLFKDVGNKYKNKYRSLRFNINDQKNNLFRRVVEKIVTPYELVRLTPEELASDELAQWREREAKHELDMIKKAELENINQAKVLVVKTHKGELEIESETLPASVTDVVVPDLQPEDLPGEKPKKSSTSALHISSNSRDKERFTSSSSSPVNKEKSSKSDHDRERDRHKKHERGRDRHKSSRSNKHRRRSSERHHSRNRRSIKSQERRDEEKKSVGSGDKEHRRSRKRSRSRSRSGLEKKDEKKIAVEVQDGVKEKDEDKAEDAIASTTSTIADTSTNLTASVITTEDEEKLAADLMNSYNPVDVDLSDMEPSSTVIIQTPPHAQSPDGRAYVWKGLLVMPDVAKFQTVLKEVSGNCVGLEEDLPPTIDSVGRIHPDMVWNYISEQKKSGRKEIVVLRFEALDDEQRVSYLSLYSYLSQKNRMAVIGGTGPDKPLKDFYVMTLASHSPVPQVLLPLDGPGFEDYRSHLLLAIIVRNKRRKFAASSLFTSSHLKKETYVPTSVVAVPTTPAKVEENESFTPPHSPTSVFVGGYSGDSKPSKNEEDEPYEPMDEDEEEKETVENEEDEPYSPGALDDERTSKSLELQREMEEINRKIEEEKQKIESMSSALPIPNVEESLELYSPSDQFATKSEIEGEPSNVQLPEDLQNLLDSFSKRANEMQSSESFTVDPIVDAYKTGIDVADYANENVDEPSFSPQPDKSENVVSQPEQESDGSTVTTGEMFEEMKTSRDPRRKLMVSGDVFQTANATQPPPPGMEEEFVIPLPVTTAGSVEPNTTVVMSDPNVFNVPTPTVPPSFGYVTASSVPRFPPPMMYMTAPPPSIYPQATPLPFTALPPPQLYVPSPTLISHDPSMIPLPTEGNVGEKSLKRKAVDDLDSDFDKERDRASSRRSDSRNRRGGSYYSDSKSRRSDSKSPPPRHKSGYESQHRGYQRDDSDYGKSGHSRYSNSKYGRNYQSRSRSGYWNSSGDYSSGHRKYSDRSRRSSSRDRDRDRDRSSRRYENSRSSKDD